MENQAYSSSAPSGHAEFDASTNTGANSDNIPRFPSESIFYWDRMTILWVPSNFFTEDDRLSALQNIVGRELPIHERLAMLSFESYGSGLSSVGVSSNVSSTRPPTRQALQNMYNACYDQHMTDHRIFSSEDSRAPGNVTYILNALTSVRRALEPRNVTEMSFQRFVVSDSEASSDQDVHSGIVPYIMGNDQTMYPSARNQQFTNLGPLTDGTLFAASADFTYGAQRADFHESVLQNLHDFIEPTTSDDSPCAMNFFIEAKGPGEYVSLPKRRAMYAGACGARAMHAIRTYGNPNAAYDGFAYAFSAVYMSHVGVLTIYAHHIQAPAEPSNWPEYHMTEIGSYRIIEDKTSFCRGVSALRNARDLAKTCRDELIYRANHKAACE